MRLPLLSFLGFSPRVALVLLCAALAAGGCSLRLAYSQLDWLVPWYLRDYVTLDAGQRSALDARLAVRLDWHCRAHVPEYAVSLREAQALLRRDTVDAAELAPFLARGEAWWAEVLAALEPDARVMLAGLANEQIDELRQAFARGAQEARAEFLGGNDAAQEAARIKRMEKRLQRWFGRMTPAQRERIAAWSAELSPTTAAWLEQRMRWQGALLDALQVRTDDAAFAARIAPLFAPQQARWPAAYREGVARNRALTLALLADVFNMAPEHQRQRLNRELDGLAAQFESLACAAPARVSAALGR
ncbi:DUF6279 family lipoprotein [Thauera sp.]|jgi:hypothetical protein|uniref:DUF6279 family lipoprotein n=1 Tax=Thauera sp. TaxID=1905334 RepID=UPI002A35E441|nr:DUF6279 family lipoprotein [Thauera sp.]MDX9884721.1 DUF6279 family lipoprotein [Thauera sp.]